MLHSAKNKNHLKKVNKLMASSGYSGQPEMAAPMETKQDKPITKLKTGGCADGGTPAERLDKRKRGGKTGNVSVNVIVPGGGKPSMPPMAPPMPPPGGMAGAAARPPMPPMQAKKGGKIPHEEFGAGGGKGRLEKIKEYGKRKTGGVTSTAEAEGKDIKSKDGNISVGS